MATVNLSNALKTSMLTQLQNAIDAGATGGTIKLYTGAIPATPATAIGSQVLLGTLTFPAGMCDAPGSNTGGVLTAGAIVQDSDADSSGIATWARIADSTGNTVMDVDVTTTTGSGAIKLNTTNIVAGGPISMASFVVSM